MDEVIEARVEARSSDGRQSYTIEFSILRVIVNAH
jgi:hypothetical protein